MRMITPRLLLATLIAQIVCAHQQPTTLVVLDIGSEHVAMKLHVPLNELEFAFGHDVTQRSEQTLAVWGPPLKEYLIDHIRPITAAGQPWSVLVVDMSVGSATQTQSGPFQEVFVELSLVSPAGASLRSSF